MKTFSLLLLLLLPFGLPAQSEQPVTVYVTGTGQTTGHVATAWLINRDQQPAAVVLGPALIPATDSAQGYVLPDDRIVRLAPGRDTLIRLRGYCTNPYLPPAGQDVELPATRHWGFGNNAPRFQPGIPLPAEYGFYPLPDTVRAAFAYPGTETAFPAWLEFDRHPVSGVHLVVDAARALENAYAELDQQGRIQTPYSEKPDQQRDAVIQHTLWHALGALRDVPYTYDDFKAALERQYAGVFGGASGQNDAFSQGLRQFWSTFEQLAAAAQVVVKR